MAVLTASAQLRSVSRQNSATADELIEFGKSVRWQQSIINYAIKYSKIAKKQYNFFKKGYTDRHSIHK